MPRDHIAWDYNRTLSDISPALAEEARQALAADLTKDQATGIVFLELTSQPRFTFLLPREARKKGSTPSRVVKDLVDRGVESQMEGVVYGVGESFGESSSRLFPLRTRGEGHNCLLNAASLGLWGVQDRDLLLRCAVCESMSSSVSGAALRKRWEAELTRSNSREFGGIELSAAQYETEWADELDRIRAPDVSLGAIHVMALAQVLRRPVVVFAQSFVRGALGDALEPDRFAGVYLPLMWAPKFCVKVPLAMTFTFKPGDVCGHFSALVGMEADSDDVAPWLPLTRDGKPLPIRFFASTLSDEEWDEEDERNVMEMYMDTAEVAVQGHGEDTVLCASLSAGRSVHGRPRELIASYARTIKMHNRAQTLMRFGMLAVCVAVVVVLLWFPDVVSIWKQDLPQKVASASRRRQGSEL